MPVGGGCSGCLEAGSGWVGPPLPGQGAYRVQKVQSFAGIGEGDARLKCLKLSSGAPGKTKSNSLLDRSESRDRKHRSHSPPTEGSPPLLKVKTMM